MTILLRFFKSQDGWSTQLELNKWVYHVCHILVLILFTRFMWCLVKGYAFLTIKR
jgi:hypothetical protein